MNIADIIKQEAKELEKINGRYPNTVFLNEETYKQLCKESNVTSKQVIGKIGDIAVKQFNNTMVNWKLLTV